MSKPRAHVPAPCALDLVGGPVDTRVQMWTLVADTVDTINIEHVNCACRWCEPHGGQAQHVYVRRSGSDPDTFVYDHSEQLWDGR